MKNREWFEFHVELLSYNLHRKGKYIPKYIAFWSGYTASNILSNTGVIKAIRK